MLQIKEVRYGGFLLKTYWLVEWAWWVHQDTYVYLWSSSQNSETLGRRQGASISDRPRRWATLDYEKSNSGHGPPTFNR